jgi:ATP-dependent Clp protease protease subunit
MIHKAWTYAMGNANDLRETADRLENIEQTIVDTYMENVAENITEDDIKQKMSDETWLSAKDAAELFPRIQEDENIDVAACISSITYNNIPKNVIVKNDDEDDEEEDPKPKKTDEDDEEDNPDEEEQKEKNSNELDMLDNFVFMEGAIENEQEDA